MNKKLKLVLHPRTNLPVLAFPDGTMLPSQTEVVVKHPAGGTASIVVTFNFLDIEIAFHEIAKIQ